MRILCNTRNLTVMQALDAELKLFSHVFKHKRVVKKVVLLVRQQ